MTDPRDSFDLAGRVAVITGAGSGIGAASARMLAAVGATVVCVDVNADSAARTADAIDADGGKATSAACDVTSSAAVEDLVRGAVADHGRLDVMGNIAGIIHNSMVVDTREEDLDRILATNLKGVFFGCQSAARVMIEFACARAHSSVPSTSARAAFVSSVAWWRACSRSRSALA